MTKAPLLIVWHSRTNTAEALARAAHEGAGSHGVLLRARDCHARDILAASGYLFACPENLATMSGEMKEMFDRSFYPVLGKIEGRPYATIIAAGSDGEGAQKQLDRIAKGWRLKRVNEPWIVNTKAQTPEEILATKTITDEDRRHARELGQGMAEGLAAGIF